MDGSFLELDGESMEVQLEEMYREILNMLKVFHQKPIKAAQELEKISGKPRGSSSKEDAKKQESPTPIVSEQIKSSEQMEDVSGTTRERPGAEDPIKKESPTLVMCSTVMNQIKKFKVIMQKIFFKMCLCLKCHGN